MINHSVYSFDLITFDHMRRRDDVGGVFLQAHDEAGPDNIMPRDLRAPTYFRPFTSRREDSAVACLGEFRPTFASRAKTNRRFNFPVHNIQSRFASA